MRVAIRADASSRLGWGHVKRCLALADALLERGAEVRFIAAPTDVDVAALVADAGFATQLLDPQATDDATATCAALAAYAADVIVVDHYALDARWHDTLRAATGALIVAIDDLADRPLAVDLLVDHNPAEDHAPSTAPCCAGRPCCAQARPMRSWTPSYREHARHVCKPRCAAWASSWGGSDAEDFSSWAVRACRELAAYAGPIEIASTSSNPQLAALHALCASDDRLSLLLDQPNLADFHARHDLQIGAGGGATWERCCLGTPAIVLACADNQIQSVPLLASSGAAVGLDARGQGPEAYKALGQAVRDLTTAPGAASARLALQQRAMALVDGLGARRVAQRLHQCWAANTLALRRATPADEALLLRWRNDPAAREASHHQDPVAPEGHARWFAAALADAERIIYIAETAGTPVAMARLQREMAAGLAVHQLSWFVSAQARGLGVGQWLLRQVLDQTPGEVRAEIKHDNKASLKLAESVGFCWQRVDDGVEHWVRAGL